MFLISKTSTPYKVISVLVAGLFLQACSDQYVDECKRLIETNSYISHFSIDWGFGSVGHMEHRVTRETTGYFHRFDLTLQDQSVSNSQPMSAIVICHSDQNKNFKEVEYAFGRNEFELDNTKTFMDATGRQVYR